ncbi:MAG: ChaB family protein [Pseudomonadota bacterium]
MGKRKYGVEMPGTLERSPGKAQRTYAKTLRAAEQEYGSGERAGRTAFASLKHGFEKVGDHWEAKDHKGPSDPQAARSGRAARESKGQGFGGVDERGHTRKELYARARALGIAGRSTMDKQALARAIAKKQG